MQHYEKECRGLGSAFLDDAQHCLQGILEHPEAAPCVRGQIRRRLFTRFPYALLYSIRGGNVRVLAVMNLRRRPFYWVDRR